MTTALVPRGGRQLFVYWRVAQGQLDAALAALQAWQHACMRDTPGLVARLYLRAEPNATDAAGTLMETYAKHRTGTGAGTDIAADCEHHLRAAGDAASAAFRIGPRHVEAFEECVPAQSTRRPPSRRS